MAEYDSGRADGFARPTALPEDNGQAKDWQRANREWWESHPMRYDWEAAVEPEEFSREFYLEIDRRFFEATEEFLPKRRIPYDRLIDFEGLGDKDVLEIGVGNGSHAQLLAQHAGSFTGIDLTSYAIESTTRRMELAGLKATIQKMDAESLEFPDESFDFVWSWGVIHHSSNTPGILEQIHRVLRPGGRCVTMVYHRGFYNFYLLHGLNLMMRGKLPKPRAIHASVQSRTDGALARYYSASEWRALLEPRFAVERIHVVGQKVALVPCPPGALRKRIGSWIPGPVGRFLAGTCRMGDLLVASFRKPA